MSNFLEKYRSKIVWSIIALIVGLSMLFAIEQDMTGFVQAWGGKCFKALGGGFMGWFIGRIVLRIDLSSMPAVDRPVAGLSMALLIMGFANAVA